MEHFKLYLQMANAHVVIILVYYSLPLSLAQMGFGGGGYCAKCAMANSGMNPHSFGFGGMSSKFTAHFSFSII